MYCLEMAKTLPTKTNSWTDGVKKLGPGKYLVRVTWTDKAGKRHDTERNVMADTKAKAQAARAQLQTELSGPRDRGWLLSTTLERYVATLLPGTKHSWGSYAKRIAKHFEGRRLGDITPAEIQRFIFQLPVADSTANSYRTVLLGAYKFARDCGEYAGANPVKETNRRRTPKTAAQLLDEQENPAKRAYLGDEVSRFLAALDPDLRPLQIIQLLLGCRFGEVSALEWRDVDLETGVVQIRRTQYKGSVGVTKGGEQRKTAVGPHGVKLLKAHQVAMAAKGWPGWERLVFPRPAYGHERAHDMWSSRTVILKVTQAQKAAGITVDSRTHAARHTHITIAAVQRALAVDDAVASWDTHRAMTGHASEAQSRAYIDRSALPAVKIAESLEKALVGETWGTDA